MTTEHVNQRNVADEEQIKKAKSDEKRIRNAELSDIRFLLETAQGRRVLWRILTYCGLYRDPTNARGDMTHQNIGRANVGRFVLAEILAANEDAYLAMMKENKEGELNV